MGKLREITDWDLAEEVARDRPALLLALISRFCPSHELVLEAVARTGECFEDRLDVRFIDLVENPSVIGTLGLRKVPAVLLYARGVESVRWEGRVSAKSVVGVVGELLGPRAKRGTS